MKQVRSVKDCRRAFSGQESLLLLHKSEQPRQKICGGLPHIYVLPWNSLVCSIQKT
jgi:hypothetical protein